MERLNMCSVETSLFAQSMSLSTSFLLIRNKPPQLGFQNLPMSRPYQASWRTAVRPVDALPMQKFKTHIRREILASKGYYEKKTFCDINNSNVYFSTVPEPGCEEKGPRSHHLSQVEDTT